MSNNKPQSGNYASPSKPSQTTPGTVSAGDLNSGNRPTGLATATGVGAAASTGPAVVNKSSNLATSTEIAPGVTDVQSHVEPTVPSPPAPNAALGIDPSHPTLDTYPSEEAAALASGIHVDLSQVAKPVGVVTHNAPPFHRMDGTTPGSSRTVSEAVDAANEESQT